MSRVARRMQRGRHGRSKEEDKKKKRRKYEFVGWKTDGRPMEEDKKKEDYECIGKWDWSKNELILQTF